MSKVLPLEQYTTGRELARHFAFPVPWAVVAVKIKI